MLDKFSIPNSPRLDKAHRLPTCCCGTIPGTPAWDAHIDDLCALFEKATNHHHAELADYLDMLLSWHFRVAEHRCAAILSQPLPVLDFQTDDRREVAR